MIDVDIGTVGCGTFQTLADVTRFVVEGVVEAKFLEPGQFSIRARESDDITVLKYDRYFRQKYMGDIKTIYPNAHC